MTRIPPVIGWTSAPADRTARIDPSLSLFLGLYLLILAFFILLVSLSTIEEMKARAVMESLSTAFGNEQPVGTTPGNEGGDGSSLVAEEFVAAVGRMVRVAEIEVIEPGRLLRVVLPPSLVFAAVDKPRASLHPLIDRAVASLSSPPAGLQVEMEFALAPGAEPASRALAARRADAFAREMLARGAPPALISIALAPAAGNNAWLTFRLKANATTSVAMPDVNR